MQDFITSIHFKNYKAFRDYSVALKEFNVLVGPNNAGKSTVLGAIRILAEALRKANSRNAEWINTDKREAYGYKVDLSDLPVSTENVFHDYNDTEPAVITFRISNGNKLRLIFIERGSCSLVCDAKKIIKTVSAFKSEYNIQIAFVPVLGPVEHNEKLFLKDAARRALLTSYASRNFRNIWHHYPERFDDFRELVKSTWPGMDIEPPELMEDKKGVLLHMFCPEERFPREIFWAGFGFQVWCQMLTFIIQAKGASLFVIDEPDIYLHSDLQRQLVNLLKELGCNIIIATHSTEIISEVDPDCILNVNKRYTSARRIRNSKELQDIFITLGSNLNPTLTQISKSRRVLFIEGKDFQLFSKYARKLNLHVLANRSDFAVIPVGGFNPKRIHDFAHGMESTIGAKLLKAVILDRDYRPDAEILKIRNELSKFCKLVHIHERKEIENYLLVPAAITKAFNQQLEKRGLNTVLSVNDIERILLEITETIKNRIQAQCVKNYCEFSKSSQPQQDLATTTEAAMDAFDSQWRKLESRLKIVPGKEVLSAFNTNIQNDYKVTITQTQIMECMTKSEVLVEMDRLMHDLDSFRCQPPPED